MGAQGQTGGPLGYPVWWNEEVTARICSHFKDFTEDVEHLVAGVPGPLLLQATCQESRGFEL
eukprot:2780907-Alexandrium_andersonii.AAC.1